LQYRLHGLENSSCFGLGLSLKRLHTPGVSVLHGTDPDDRWECRYPTAHWRPLPPRLLEPLVAELLLRMNSSGESPALFDR
jgi:hypothetical protein